MQCGAFPKAILLYVTCEGFRDCESMISPLDSLFLPVKINDACTRACSTTPCLCEPQVTFCQWWGG